MRLPVPALPLPARVPVFGLKVRLALVRFENGVALPPAPGVTAVTVTVELEREATTVVGMSALIALTILVAAEVELVPTVTSPVVVRDAAQVNVCGPTMNC